MQGGSLAAFAEAQDDVDDDDDDDDDEDHGDEGGRRAGSSSSSFSSSLPANMVRSHFIINSPVRLLTPPPPPCPPRPYARCTIAEDQASLMFVPHPP
jgi:hypothetical protein